MKIKYILAIVIERFSNWWKSLSLHKSNLMIQPMERIKLLKSDGYWRGKVENLLYNDKISNEDIVNEILKLKNELLKLCEIV